MTRRSPVWHPFTQHAVQPDPEMIARGSGAWLETPDGRRILDAISSWWVITHGHANPRITAAIRAQAGQLDQVIFAGFTHEPAEQLATKLLSVAPAGLSHVFFSDSGSTAVEVALKMALGTWHNRGEARTTVVALEHGYHGDTTAAMSAGARGLFSQPYAPMLFDVARLPFPHEGAEQATLDALEAICTTRKAAALIVEPLILGAGGMLSYPPRVLHDMHEICARHGTLFIADEVMTGWGRTGTLFACEQAGITPDILCTAKGLTGGSLPLAATLSKPEIFDAHYSTDRARTFFHSSSYTANPICCAAALANLAVWEDEPVLDRISALGALQDEKIAQFKGDKRFTNVRRVGTMTALDLAVVDAGYLASAGPGFTKASLARGVLLRPLGNTIYVMPPYCTTSAELDMIYGTIDAAASEALAGI